MRKKEFLEMVGKFIFSQNDTDRDVMEKFCRAFTKAGIPLVVYSDSSEPQDFVIELCDYNEGMIEKFGKISRSIKKYGIDGVWEEMRNDGDA